MSSSSELYHNLPTLQPRSLSSFVIDNIKALEHWLLRHKWIMQRPQNAVERSRFLKQGRALIIAYRGSISLVGAHDSETRTDLAELLEEATS